MADESLGLPLSGGQAKVPERRCRVCGVRKPHDQFEHREYGRARTRCRDCANAAHRDRYSSGPGYREYLRKWDRANPEKKREYGRASYARTRNDFRRFLMKMITNKRSGAKRLGVEFAIEVDNLLDLYVDQQGRCALSGRPLEWGSKGMQRDTLSIDRVYQTQGYVPGNIRLVTYQANFARNRFSDEELFAFCEAVLATRAGTDGRDSADNL